MKNYEELLRDILEEFPDFQIVVKSESRLMVCIDKFLKIVTLGRMKTFMTGFTTTVGNTTYVSTNWNELSRTIRSIVLRHERIHLRQAKSYSRFFFSFLYIFVLPVFWTYRSKFEREAYEETMRASVEAYGLDVLNDTMKSEIVGYLSSHQYFWMMRKKSAELWFDETKEKILLEKEVENGSNN